MEALIAQDLNGDGVVSLNEYLAYRAMLIHIQQKVCAPRSLLLPHV